MSYDLSILLQTLLKHAERYLHGIAERHHLAARVKRVPIGRSYGANPKSAMKCFSEFVRVKLELVEPSTSIHGKKAQQDRVGCVRVCGIGTATSTAAEMHSCPRTQPAILLFAQPPPASSSSSPHPHFVLSYLPSTSTHSFSSTYLTHFAAPDLVRQRSRLPVYPSTSSVHVRRSSPTSAPTTKPIHTAPPPLH